MTSIRFGWLVLLLALPITSAAVAAPVTLRSENLEPRLFEDIRDGQLDEFDLVSAALVASGIHDQQSLERLVDRLEATWDSWAAEHQTVPIEPRQLFEFLHGKLLTGTYHVEYSSLARTIEEGHYNCVTATLLFAWLCERSGLAINVMATREHVFVRLANPPFDVESTCPEWFSQSPLPPVAAGIPKREITPAELIGKVYYNRAVQRLSHQEYAHAITLLETSLMLDPQDDPARENLLAAINNWALSEARSGQFEAAGELLKWGRSVDPDYEPFEVNDVHIHQLWVVALCQEDRFAEAIEVLEEGLQRRGDVELFDAGRLTVYQLWLEQLIESGNSNQVEDVLASARARFSEDARWQSHEAAAFELLADPAGLTNSGS